MDTNWYVAVDAKGVEHTPTGRVRWHLPSPDADGTTSGENQKLVLRRPTALLDVLEARIFVAEPLGSAKPGEDGTLEV
ncbi:MAG TPA: hypothetical protein VKT78_02895, partial [Fimbriimonadaceae bacterium]|nr:hypothetical protein [Fimbriimonadaceae bacterium]